MVLSSITQMKRYYLDENNDLPYWSLGISYKNNKNECHNNKHY